MFIETRRVPKQYIRISKLKKSHTYTRYRTVAVLGCDCCGSLFERDLGLMDHRRLNDTVFHVCSNCDAKRFAQSKGAERKRFWNLTADLDIDITKN
jgi:hypothetical protein